MQKRGSILHYDSVPPALWLCRPPGFLTTRPISIHDCRLVGLCSIQPSLFGNDERLRGEVRSSETRYIGGITHSWNSSHYNILSSLPMHIPPVAYTSSHWRSAKGLLLVLRSHHGGRSIRKRHSVWGKSHTLSAFSGMTIRHMECNGFRHIT